MSGYTLRFSTSHPPKHVTRRLLSSLDHQETTTSRRRPSYRCARGSPQGSAKPSKSARHMDDGFHLAVFDITSTETRHETSTELSRPPGDDDIAYHNCVPPGPCHKFAHYGGVNHIVHSSSMGLYRAAHHFPDTSGDMMKPYSTSKYYSVQSR